MTPLDSLSGLILAGGRARRMQGASPVDKGLLELDGEPLVARAQRFLAPRTDPVFISANRHLAMYCQYGKVVTDDMDLGQDLGPLAGVASTLMLVETSWLMVIPVDVPFLPRDLIESLAAAIVGQSAKIAYACDARSHPLCMMLHKSLQAALRAYLLDGGRAVQRWQKSNQAVAVNFRVDDLAFFNINTPEDLCLARQLAQSKKP